MTGQAATWPGCHGVVLSGGDGRFGECRGKPLAALEIAVGEPARPGPVELWCQELPDGNVQRASSGPDSRFVLEVGPENRVSLAPDGDVVTVAESFDWIDAQLVASFVLPFLVGCDRRLVLHAAAASRDGQAVLIAGPGGTGKSSSLVGLADSGWAPLSEDVCVVDLSGPDPVVWPGPPWVRRAHGEPGPSGARVLFESSEKTAWDVAPLRGAPGPTPVTALIVLDAPSPGVSPTRAELGHGEAIGALAPHSVWLGDRREAGPRLFGPVAEAVARIPVSVLRLPVADDWIGMLLELVG